MTCVRTRAKHECCFRCSSDTGPYIEASNAQLRLKCSLFFGSDEVCLLHGQLVFIFITLRSAPEQPPPEPRSEVPPRSTTTAPLPQGAQPRIQQDAQTPPAARAPPEIRPLKAPRPPPKTQQPRIPQDARSPKETRVPPEIRPPKAAQPPPKTQHPSERRSKRDDTPGFFNNSNNAQVYGGNFTHTNNYGGGFRQLFPLTYFLIVMASDQDRMGSASRYCRT